MSRQEETRRHYLKYKERILEDRKRYYEANREKIKARTNAHYWANKPEIRKKQRAYYAKNKQKYRDYELFKRHRLRREDYEKMAAEQGGCGICGRQPDYVLRVDHCHATGKTRGLLCNKCNLALGHFEDRIDWLLNAVAYLRKHSQDDIGRMEARKIAVRNDRAG